MRQRGLEPVTFGTPSYSYRGFQDGRRGCWGWSPDCRCGVGRSEQSRRSGVRPADHRPAAFRLSWMSAQLHLLLPEMNLERVLVRSRRASGSHTLPDTT